MKLFTDTINKIKVVSLCAILLSMLVPLAFAHNKVVVIPLGDQTPAINMQCQDGGLEFSSCGNCSSAETTSCCAEQSSLCTSDSECIALTSCLTNCSGGQSCIDSCRDLRSTETLALFDDVTLCLNGTGEPNLDGACGLICGEDPPSEPPEQDIFVELTWNTPGDSNQDDTGPGVGTDLDLHFAHSFADEPDLDGDEISDPWFDNPFDTFPLNSNPNWANPDPAVDDNPELILDDTDGKGPEIITLNNPENLDYYIGVYSTKSNGFGDSLASITVWSEGVIVYQAEAILRERDMWWVGRLSGGSTTFTPDAGDNNQFRISPNYEHPSFPP